LQQLGRRRESAGILDKKHIKTSADIAGYLRASLKDSNHEVFVTIYLNQSNKILDHKTISIGGITGTVADTRLILRSALEMGATAIILCQMGATAIILCHNHPSGNLRPSNADNVLTQKVKEAAALMDIKVMDHIIVSNEGYYSFADDGML